VIAEPEEDYFARVEEKEKWLNDYRANMASILADCRRKLIAAGFPEQAVEIRLPGAIVPRSPSASLWSLTVPRAAPSSSAVAACPQGEFLFGSVSSKNRRPRPQLRRMGGGMTLRQHRVAAATKVPEAISRA